MSNKLGDKKTGATDFVKSDYDKALILDSVHADNLMSSVTLLAAEVWVLRRRLMISEKLAAQKIFATAAAIDAYKPTAAEEAEWNRERDTFIDRTLSVLTRPAVRLEGARIPLERNSAPLTTL